ncbi:acyl-CoA synthetase [Robertmurraya andreesenii]|uniref:Fatty-acyl-CoA synthase n=1 Tax=Anoxybacillus andreesenii TaxID=1325932 RepID=A0ABT9UYR4_9BACL|nr:long-chain fatty acid--CoA ligase [Robertmurraya andreesenii]MDQ0153822.1 fatty-acyl-CoA synthase [Robertmurraya andreesenii]
MVWELDWLEGRMRIAPNKQAIIDAEQEKDWTFAKLHDLCVATANWLYEQGVRKGDRVALLSPNDISYFQLLIACGKIGAIFVPINWRLSFPEIEYILQDCTPKLVGYHSSFSENIRNEIFSDYQIFQVDKENNIIDGKPFFVDNLDEKDPLAIIYTGGTTGKPKGVVLSHQSIIWNAMNTIISWNLTNDDTTITYMPLFHTGGINALSLPILIAGGTVVIARDFKPEKAIYYLNKYQCTTVLLVPTMYQMLIETDEFKRNPFQSMKVFLSGGAPCPLDIYEAFKRKGILFKEGYGLTEAGPNNFFIDPVDALRKPGSVGKPMMFNLIKLMKKNGEETAVDEVGEVLIKGKHSFEYYWKNEEATKETMKDGWIHTGDLAKKDEEGYYYIVGRKKDMIITGGENVYPLEVEHWLCAHPQIEEVAVIGIPDKKWGEKVVAFIVAKNHQPLTDEELKSYCSHKLGKYKIPKVFHFIEQLPTTPVGKIDKKLLKEMSMKIVSE